MTRDGPWSVPYRDFIMGMGIERTLVNVFERLSVYLEDKYPLPAGVYTENTLHTRAVLMCCSSSTQSASQQR
jgi:hypothetical protein